MKELLMFIVGLLCFTSLSGQYQDIDKTSVEWQEILRLHKQAEEYSSNQNFEDAIRSHQSALKIFKSNYGMKSAYYGVFLGNLAASYEAMGAYNKALPLFLEAVTIIENSLGKKNIVYASSLGGLGHLYATRRAYEKALPLLLEALEIIENTAGKYNISYGYVLNELGLCYTTIGAYDKALPIYLEAIEIKENILGKDDPAYGTALNNLGHLYSLEKNYVKALPFFLEALENTKNSLGKDHSTYGVYLGNLGRLYMDQGAYKKALPLFQEALQIIMTSLGKDHQDYWYALNNLGAFYLAQGAFDKAMPIYQEALKSIENSLGKDHPDYLNSLAQLDLIYIANKEFNNAYTILIESVKKIEIQILRNFSFMTQEEKVIFTQKIGEGFNSFSNFNYLTNYSYPEGLSYATNNILTRKGLLLNANKNILEELRGLERQEIDQKVNEFSAKRAFIQKQLQLPISERAADFDQRKEDLESLERQIVELHTENFGEQVKLIRDFKETPLQEDELAIEFTHFKIRNRNWTDSTMYVAYLYKKQWDTPKAVNLFEEKQLQKYLGTISDPNILYKPRGADVTENTPAVSDSIYALVWKPLEAYIDENTTIYYSPDGLLHKIPFDALPNNENELLGSVYNLNLLSNTADVGRKKQVPDLEDVLLIGGVFYDYDLETKKVITESRSYSFLQNEFLLGNEETKKSRGSAEYWFYLPGTSTEINDIKALLPNSSILQGSEATETAFKNLSGKSPSIIHIATHGYFFPDLEKEKDAGLSIREKPYVHAKNPLLRSGLMFANANYAWQNGSNPFERDDGILTALEISNLDLNNTDIVILSACETGLGDVPSSEGVYGLQRAFKMAGVKSIIMALWNLNDGVTPEFMSLFYKNWKHSNDPKAAFNEAQKTMMAKYRDEPKKWAAFVYLE